MADNLYSPYGYKIWEIYNKRAGKTSTLKQVSYFSNPHKYCPVPLEGWVTPQQINVYNKDPTRHKKTSNLCQRGAAIISWERPETFFYFLNQYHVWLFKYQPGGMNALYPTWTSAGVTELNSISSKPAECPVGIKILKSSYTSVQPSVFC